MQYPLIIMDGHLINHWLTSEKTYLDDNWPQNKLLFIFQISIGHSLPNIRWFHPEFAENQPVHYSKVKKMFAMVNFLPITRGWAIYTLLFFGIWKKPNLIWSGNYVSCLQVVYPGREKGLSALLGEKKRSYNVQCSVCQHKNVMKLGLFPWRESS